MRLHQTAALATAMLGLWTVAAASPRPGGAPRYTNAEVVSINLQERTLAIRDAKGVEQTVELDDTVAGLPGVEAGDHVILTLRDEPGRPRVTSIAKSVAPRTPSRRLAAAAPPAPDDGEARQAAAREAFSEEVATLAEEAGRIDARWAEFVRSCDVTVTARYEDAREWFALWDGQASADLSSGSCRDQFNQIVALGQALKARMTTAEDTARRTLEPGTIREVRRRHSMDWDGWARPAPARREP
jgi:hypothetical protein